MNTFNKNHSDAAVIVGPPLSYQLLAITPFTQSKNIPVISYGAESTATPLPSIPGFYRVTNSVQNEIEVLFEISRSFNWKKVGLLYSNEAWGLNNLKTIMEMNHSKMKNDKIDLAVVAPIHYGNRNDTELKQDVEAAARLFCKESCNPSDDVAKDVKIIHSVSNEQKSYLFI